MVVVCPRSTSYVGLSPVLGVELELLLRARELDPLFFNTLLLLDKTQC